MRQYLVRHLRSIGVSAAAFGLAICAPLAAAQAPAPRPEPRFGEAPAGEAPAQHVPAGDQIAPLEADLAAVDAEIANIRKALDVLGPLPDHPGLFIPVSLDDGAGRDISQLYAVAPKIDSANSLFHQAELGSFASRIAAEERWRQLSETNRLAGLRPAYADVGGQVRLVAGPLGSAAEVEALCVELAALAGPCRPVAPIRAW